MKYVTQGELSVELFERIGANNFMPKAAKLRLGIAGGILIAGGLFEILCAIMLKENFCYVIAGIFILVGISVILSIPFTAVRFLKYTKQRFLENVPAGRVMMEATFVDDGIELRRLDQIGSEPAFVKYEDIKSLNEVIESNYEGAPIFAGLSASGNNFYVFLGSLDEADRKELMSELAKRDLKISGIHKNR